ncbi:MAG TPA: hypothetical protein DCP28_35125 [Cytophagales bacterium]|nr:hypothetical protein [Cytophagales bacterium]
MGYVAKLKEILLLVDTTVAKGDIRHIHQLLKEAGHIHSPSYIGKVMSGTRQNDEVLKAVIRYFRFKAIMEKDFKQWIQKHVPVDTNL